MGGCFSDVRGGKQAVGVGLTGPSLPPMPTSDGAVDPSFQARRLRQLFTQVEVGHAEKIANVWGKVAEETSGYAKESP